MRDSHRPDATISEIASRARVSITTVSRVLNRSGHPVSQEARARVLEAARALDYHPSAAARALSMRRTNTVGILVPDVANPYYAEMVHSIERVTRPAGYTVLLTDANREPARTRDGLALFRSQRVDGVVVAGGGTDKSADLELLKRGSIPAIVIGRHRLAVPSVRVDNVHAGRLAAEHLAACGHREVAFVCGPASLTTVKDRLLGFATLCRRDGIALHIEPGDFRPASGYEAARRILAERSAVTAICAGNDNMAIGTMAACADAGIAIPSGVAVMGFDDTPLARYVRPTLTSIAISTSEMGEEAARLLIALMNGERVREVTWAQARLIARASTDWRRE